MMALLTNADDNQHTDPKGNPMKGLILAATLALTPFCAAAQSWAEDDATKAFVESNVLATFYHELGHGLIDILRLPVLGREEDAVDTLSALMINDLWDEESAVNMVYHTAGAFNAFAAEAARDGTEPDYAGQHSLDMQRYFNLVCLFYGANPDERADLAKELGLPADRAELCPDEYTLAQESWGVMLQDLEPTAETKGLVMEPGDSADPVYALLSAEVAELNKSYGLPVEVAVNVDSCGEANAFYYPSEKRITLCTEYADDLGRLWSEIE